WLSAGSYDNTIGGATFGMGNVISGNRSHGVTILDSGSNSNVVQGNHIGTNYLSNTAVPNAANGVSIEGGAKYNTIGGYNAVTANIISGNTGNGVAIVAKSTSSNSAFGNDIGTSD